MRLNAAEIQAIQLVWDDLELVLPTLKPKQRAAREAVKHLYYLRRWCAGGPLAPRRGVHEGLKANRRRPLA
jgi:hypothetical protein